MLGAGKEGQDLAIDVSFVLVEAYPDKGFYLEARKGANLAFFPFVLGAHGGFGRKVKALRDFLVSSLGWRTPTTPGAGTWTPESL